MVGVGRPSALQFRVVGSPLETMTSEGCSTILGESLLDEDEIRQSECREIQRAIVV